MLLCKKKIYGGLTGLCFTALRGFFVTGLTQNMLLLIYLFQVNSFYCFTFNMRKCCCFEKCFLIVSSLCSTGNAAAKIMAQCINLFPQCPSVCFTPYHLCLVSLAPENKS